MEAAMLPKLAPDSDELISPKEVAAILRVHYVTLSEWRGKGTGPAFIKLGDGIRAPVRYRSSDLYNYLNRKNHDQN